MSDPTVPAILGGDPVRGQGFPAWPILDDGVRNAFEQLMQSGDWGCYQAEHSQLLIERLKSAYQAKHVFLTCSGTVANEIALRALQIESGDEVIMSAYDYKPNFMNVRHVGAMPVLVDVRRDNAQLNVDLVSDAITEKTKAVLASHLHGAMVDLSMLRQAIGNGIAIIEDACQMPGATHLGNAAGMTGDIGVISFGGTKTLSAGRGGAVLTNDARLAQLCTQQTDRGNAIYPLSEMQAALLLPQFDAFEERKSIRAEQVEQIRVVCRNRSYLTPLPAHADACPDYYKLGFWYDASALGGVTREQFIQVLRAERIPFGPGFRALHLIHSRKRLRMSGELPIAEFADVALLGLHHPFLLETNAAAELTAALDKLESHARMVREQVI